MEEMKARVLTEEQVHVIARALAIRGGTAFFGWSIWQRFDRVIILESNYSGRPLIDSTVVVINSEIRDIPRSQERTMNKLANKVAVVTGASKGTGIAKGLSGGSGGGRELLLEQGFCLDYGRDASGFGRDAVTKLDGREESLQRLTSAGFVWWSGSDEESYCLAFAALSW